MSYDNAMITQTLHQHAIGYRLTLDSAENCLKAGVNPITGRHLITTEQAAHLAQMLADIRAANQHESDKTLLAIFAPQAVHYLRQIDRTATRDTAMHEVMDNVKDHYARHTDVKYQPQGTPDAERTGNPGNHRHWRQRQSITAQGAMLALYGDIEKFKTKFGLTNQMIGAACIGERTHEPMLQQDVGNALSVLGSGKGVASPLRYILREPDAFFGKLESAMETRGTPTTIGTEQRNALTESISAALEQHRATIGKRAR